MPPCLHPWYCSTGPSGCPSARYNALRARTKKIKKLLETNNKWKYITRTGEYSDIESVNSISGTFLRASSVSLSWLPTCTLTSRGQCAAKADRDASPSCLQRYAVYFCRLGQWEAREDTPWSWTPLQSEMLISVIFCLREAILTRRSSFTCEEGNI